MSQQFSRHQGGLWHRWLLLIPFTWQIGFVPLVNEVELRPFSLPFPMVWQMAGILVTTVVIAVVFAVDRRREAEGADDADRAESNAK